MKLKTATEILWEYSIDIMKMDDEFNSNLLHAMEVYASQFKGAEEAVQPSPENNQVAFDKLIDSYVRGDIGYSEVVNQNNKP